MTLKRGLPEWPKRIAVGSVVVTVYRSKVKSNASGFGYDVVWKTPALGRQKQQFADAGVAVEEARVKAAQLAAGRVEGAEMSLGDRDELRAARALVEPTGRPVLAALDEWLKAWKLTNGHVLDAADIWARRQVTKFRKHLAPAAVDAFIAYKSGRGRRAKRTYGSKLKPIKTHFATRHLDEINALEWSAYLGQWSDGVTQNDYRKRAIELCKWARDVAGYLPKGVPTEVELTERAHEEATEIGILIPTVWSDVLHWVREHHAKHLAAVVVAGFCGVRSDEIHGKRDEWPLGEKCRRQTWEDIDAAQKHLNVTNAKRNTPAWRLVPICDAAFAWLALCPGERKGPICEVRAMEKIRVLLREAGFALPENCFRHSFISYEIAVTGDKAKVATWAGNSVKEIDRRYRRPALPDVGKAWFSVLPKVK